MVPFLVVVSQEHSRQPISTSATTSLYYNNENIGTHVCPYRDGPKRIKKEKFFALISKNRQQKSTSTSSSSNSNLSTFEQCPPHTYIQFNCNFSFLMHWRVLLLCIFVCAGGEGGLARGYSFFCYAALYVRSFTRALHILRNCI